MPLIKLNNRSIKDVTSLPFGVGNMILISSQTASNSASISFTTGIDSTYKEYQFYFIDLHPRTDGTQFLFNMSTNGGSTYVVTKTTTIFLSYHSEDNTQAVLSYDTSSDNAQSTAFQRLSSDLGNGADESFAGSMSLFNPSSTTYVKHFICTNNHLTAIDYSINGFIAGYGNTTSAINAVQFKMASGNFDGTIAMFGVL
jgi:hypothetical protein